MTGRKAGKRLQRLAAATLLPTLSRLLLMGLLGSIVLTAGATADEHPDFSGVWGLYLAPGQTLFGVAPQVLPLTPEGKKRVDEYNALVGPTLDNPGAHCVGLGMPAHVLTSGAYPLEIIQRPEQITMIYEVESETRRVYFGDRNIPEADRFPDRNGYSSGHWEGDTLVVETTHLSEQVDQTYAHSDHARIVERFQLTTDDKGTRVLVDHMTITDPAFYTKPVTIEKKWALMPTGHVMSYNCTLPDWERHLDDLRAKTAAGSTKTPK